jgi:hypothetical protein
MNLKNRPFPRRFKHPHAWLLLLAGPLTASRVLGGTGILANPAPAPAVVPPAMQDDVVNNPMNVFKPTGVDNGNSQDPFQYGPVTLRPHLDYNFSYGNGIQASPTNQQDTAIQQISPGLLANLGKHWSVDYTPTIRLYSNSQFKDGVDHSLSLVGGTHYEDWSFGLSQDFLYTTAPTAVTGTQTEQQNFDTSLTVSRILNDRFSLDLGLNQTLSFAEGLQNSREWSTMDWVNYAFTQRLNVGVGAGVGYVNEDIGPDETYEQIQGRVNWRATDKLSFQLSGGGQDRQYAASSQPNSLTPIFSGAIQYLPFEDTQISVSASRSVSPSVIPGSDSTTTSFGLALTQRLFKDFSLNLGAGYGISKYTEIVAPFPGLPLYFLQNRTDDNYSFNVRLSHPMWQRGTWAIFYQYNDNQSSEPGFGYKSNQFGFELTYRY